MNGKTDQRLLGRSLGSNADRRDEILRVAFDVFAEKGYSEATMLEIARRARASKETLYSWFQNKEKLFETLLLTLVGEIRAKLPDAGADVPEPQVFLPRLAEAILRVNTTPSWIAMMRIAVSEAARFPELSRVMTDLFLSSREELISYFGKCRLRGLMEFEDATEAAGLFLSMVEGDWPAKLLFGMINEVSDDRIVARAAQMSRLFLKAVTPPAATAPNSGKRRPRRRPLPRSRES